MPKTSSPNGQKVDPETDRYPTFDQAIKAVKEHDDFPDGPVERVEIVCHASGEASWRIYTPRAEEPRIGFKASF